MHLLNFRSEVISRFQLIDSRLDVFSAHMNSFGLLLPGMKAILDFGTTLSALPCETFENRARLAQLERPAAQAAYIYSTPVPTPASALT
jgi:hypothetical protein